MEWSRTQNLWAWSAIIRMPMHWHVPKKMESMRNAFLRRTTSQEKCSITLFNPRFMIPSNDFASTTARPLLMSMLKSNLHTVFKKSIISSGCLKVMFIVLILFTSFCLNGYEILFTFHIYHSTFFIFKRVKFFIKVYFFN